MAGPHHVRAVWARQWLRRVLEGRVARVFLRSVDHYGRRTVRVFLREVESKEEVDVGNWLRFISPESRPEDTAARLVDWL